MRVARFTHPSGLTIDVERADVWATPADVLILGRAPHLRREIAAAAGRKFEAAAGRLPRWSTLEGALPWRSVLAFDGRVRERALPRRRSRITHVPHAWRTLSEIARAWRQATTDPSVSTVAMLGLSATAPRLSSIVTVSAVHGWAVGILASGWDPSWLHSLHDAAAGIVAETDEAAAQGLSDSFGADERPPATRDIRLVLVDRDDPSPFVEALSNRRQCLIGFGGVPARRWRRHPFVRVE